MMRKSVRYKTICAAIIILTLLLTTVMEVCGSSLAYAATNIQKPTTAWSFCVMGDTQWTLATDPAGNNPNGVSTGITIQRKRSIHNTESVYR